MLITGGCSTVRGNFYRRGLPTGCTSTTFRVCPGIFSREFKRFLVFSWVFERGCILGRGETTYHQMNHTQLTPRLAAGCRAFIVLTQAPIPPAPGIGPFHDPPVYDFIKR